MSVTINSLVRKNIAELKPYSSARDEFQLASNDATKGSLVYLDANENPYNTAYNRYPDPHQLELKKKIGEIKGISPDCIFLGNGSDEAIDLLIRAFCEPGVDHIIVPQPTYGMYSVCASINCVEVKSVLLSDGFHISIPAIEQVWNNHSKIIFLCSPNNPSGNLLNMTDIKSLLARFKGLVVVDEAYIDFTESSGFVPALPNYNNLVILQTLSKAWGLAGLRLGMCFAHPEVINVLNKIKPPYNINTLTQSTAIEYLQNVPRTEQWVKEIREQRQWLEGQLRTNKLVEHVFPSEANFILVKVKNATIIYNQLIEKKIVVRDRSNVILCDGCLRITVGTKEENKIVINALNKL